MNVRLNKLIEVSNHLREVLTYELSESSRKELQDKLDLATNEISEIVKGSPVIK